MSRAPAFARIDLPEPLAQAVWRGDALGGTAHPVIPSGHALLDAELPGGGWPCRNLTDILITQNLQAEWRLLAPALAQVMRLGGSVLLIGPPGAPYLPGLVGEGLNPRQLLRVDASALAERLWATEQALKASCFTAVLSWLPHAQAGQIRRLQACAARHPGPVFVLRPAESRIESSAAPLRVVLGLGPSPHPLQVEILKRRGPVLDHTLQLAHWPAALAPLLPQSQPVQPAIRQPAPVSVPAAMPSRQPSSRPSHLPLAEPHAALDGLAARLAAIAASS